MPSKLMLGEHWIRFSSGFPVYQVRLFHRERLRFADHGHGQREVTLYPIGYMKEPYLHYAFSKGFHDWLSKHARYAIQEAEQAFKDGSISWSSFINCFSVEAVRRRVL